MLCPSSPNRATRTKITARSHKKLKRTLRGSSQSSLKQVKLSDLFGSGSGNNDTPFYPKPSQESLQNISPDFSSPPSMRNINTSTPCASSSLTSDPFMDVDSTDSDTDFHEDHDSDDHYKRPRTLKSARATSNSWTTPGKPFIRRVGGPKPGQTCPSFFPSLNKPRDGLRWRSALEQSLPGVKSPKVLNTSLSRLSYLSSFKSHPTQDEYFVDRFTVGESFMAPPFACAFSNEAKRGGNPRLAVASEEGVITIIDTTLHHQEGLTSRNTIHAHQNAIFDVKWSPQDQYLATSSGDQSIGVFDPKTGQDVARLSGHLCTTKCVQWDPINPNILASGSRDGQIRLWDIRTAVGPINGVDAEAEEADTDFNTNTIKNAHGLHSRRTSSKRTALRSVTSITFNHRTPHQLFSAGSADGVVKLWDLRRPMRRFVNPQPLLASPDHGASRGISSLVLSPDSSALYALSQSNQILALDAFDISKSTPVKTYRATPASQRTRQQGSPTADFRVGSFYVRLALSSREQGRYLTAGSSDGSLWMWDTQTGEDLCLKGHSKEVGGLDCAWDAIASCSDDLSIRLWRSNNSWQAKTWLGA